MAERAKAKYKRSMKPIGSAVDRFVGEVPLVPGLEAGWTQLVPQAPEQLASIPAQTSAPVDLRQPTQGVAQAAAQAAAQSAAPVAAPGVDFAAPVAAPGVDFGAPAHGSAPRAGAAAATALTAAKRTVNSVRTYGNGHPDPPGNGTTAPGETSNTARNADVTAPAAATGTLAVWSRAAAANRTTRGRQA